MITCPHCGASNDPQNRFCDQCGYRLAGDAPHAPPVVQAASVCPTCGAAVVPGEAFCEQCGAALEPIAPLAGGPAAMPHATVAPSGGGVICPACGHLNLPGDAFCDNCGASLVVIGKGEATAMSDSPTPTVNPHDEPPAAEHAVPVVAEDAVAPPAADELPAADEAVAAPAPAAGEGPGLAEAQQAAPAAPADALLTAETPAAAAPAPMPVAPAERPSDRDARRAEWEREIAAQEAIIAQLEPVAQVLGANTPAGVQQSLDAARAARDRARAELESLKPPEPAIDPAEVARLEGEIAAQEAIIAQLEPVAQALGANTPAGVQQSLDDARAARDRARAELAVLTGGAPAPAATPTPAAEAAPTAEATPTAPPAAEEVPVPPAPALAAAPVPAPTPVPSGPRLVLEESGRVIALPLDRAEITIGREDPVSGIFPEIDLTPFGGEAGGVSRQHARMVRTGAGWTIVDLNSTNYTRVDGVKAEPGVAVPIHDGSRIQVGRLELTFYQ